MCFRIAPLKTLTLTKKEYSLIKKTWWAADDADIRGAFQEKAAAALISKAFQEHAALGVRWAPWPMAGPDAFYMSLLLHRDDFIQRLHSGECAHCEKPLDGHVAGRCLFHPTQFLSTSLRWAQRCVAILAVPLTPLEVKDANARDSSTVYRHLRTTRVGAYHSRTLWRKAELRSFGPDVGLVTVKSKQWPVKELHSNIVETGGPLVAMLTPDVLAFVRRVNQVLAEHKPKGLKELAKTLPSGQPWRPDPPVPEALLPELHITTRAVPPPKAPSTRKKGKPHP